MKKLILIGLVVTQLCFGVTPCQAGLLDWLFHRRSCCRPAAYPVTTAQSPCGATQVLQRVVVNYAPQTTFRTAWQQVPVTYYRPVTGVDPGSCCPTTTLQPCTAMQWQVRRVPVTCYRPIYSTVAVNALSPVTTLAAPPASCASCSPATVPYESNPYAAPSTQIVPGAPGTWVPQQPLSDPSDAEIRRSDDPADRAPALDRSGINSGGLGTTSRLYAPTLETGSGIILRGPDGADVRTAFPVQRNTNLRPIPDPDREPGAGDLRVAEPGVGDTGVGEPGVPQLLETDDKTAGLPFRTATYSKITWPERARAVSPVKRKKRVPTPKPGDAEETWDESGWRSSR